MDKRFIHLNRHLRVHSEKYYLGLIKDPELHVKLTGNWETTIGEQDTFFHILEYENYGGYDKTTKLIQSSEVGDTFSANGLILNRVPALESVPEDGPIFDIPLVTAQPGVCILPDSTTSCTGRYL